MRRLYVLSLMSALTAGAFAQALAPQFEMTQPKLEREYVSVYDNAQKQTKAPAADWIILGYTANGVYFVGLNEQLATLGTSMALTGLEQPGYFGMAYGGAETKPTDVKWYYNNAQGQRVDMPVTEDGFGILKNLGQVDYPILSAAYNGETKEYIKAEDPQIDGKCDGAGVFNVFNKELPITMADIPFYGGVYGKIGGDENYFGAGYKDKEGNPLTAAFSRFNKTTSPVKVYSAIIPLCIINQGEEANISEPLKVELWTMDDKEIAFGEKLGEAELTSEQLISSQQKGFYTGKVDFMTMDDMGLPIPSPVVIPAKKTFAVVVNGLDKANLCVMLCPNQMGANGYTLHGGYDKIYTIPFSNSPSPCADLAISLIADIPAAAWQDPAMSCPVEGGAASVEGGQQPQPYAVLYTSVPMMDENEEPRFTFETPDWLHLGNVSVIGESIDDWEKNRAYAVEFTADALPAGEKGRQGVIKAISETGVEEICEVGQGEWTPTGVESVAAPKANVTVAGDNLMLTYGEEYNNVTVYNVAGETVASYALPQGGSFEVPAADLNGVYMVVFGGASREVVKVVK